VYGIPEVVVGLANSSVQYYNGSNWIQLVGTGWQSNAKQLAVQWTSANPSVVVGLSSSAVEYDNGDGWSQLQGTGWDNSVNCMEVNWPASGNPQVVVGLGNSSVQYYNGSSWTQLHDTGWKNSIGSMAVNWNGAGTPEIVVGLGNGSVQYYNGSSWNQLQGMGWGSNAGQLAVQWTSANPQVVVGLNSGAVEYYNGNSWSQLQDTSWGSSVTGMEVNWPASGAPLVVVGLSDGYVQYYNGSSWNQLQGSAWGSSVSYLQVNWLGLENPQIIVGLVDGSVQSFSGSNWSQLQGTGWGSAIACGSAQWYVSPVNGSSTTNTPTGNNSTTSTPSSIPAGNSTTPSPTNNPAGSSSTQAPTSTSSSTTSSPTTSSTSTVTQTPSTSTSTTPTPQNTCSVTNNLILPTSPNTPAQTGWDGSIVVINANNTSSTSTVQYYLQTDLILLNFLDEGATVKSETSSTSSVLPVNQVGELNLLPYYQPGTQTQQLSYTLLVSQANNYFPVAVVGEDQKLINFPAISIPQSIPPGLNSSSAANAYVFLQNIMAYPSSPLAQQFMTALNQGNTASPPTSPIAAANAFFASTTDYTNVNFEIYSSVSSYASAYAYIWANFQQSYTYHFYTVTPTSGNSSSATDSTNVKESEQFSSLGTVVLTQTGGTPAAISDANAGYSITWNPKSGAAFGLNFVDGQLVANNSDGFSSFCLQTTFMDMGQLTGNTADMGTPIQALVGVINGSNVIGSSIDLSLTEAAKWSKGYDDVVDSKTWNVLQTAMSLYFMIDIGVKFGEWIADQFKKGESPSADEAAKAQSDIKDQAQEKLENSGNDDELNTGDAVVEEQINIEWNTEIIVSESEQIDHQFEEETIQTELGENSDVINEEINQSDLEAEKLSEVDPASINASGQLQDIQDQISSNQQQIDNENVISDNATNQQVEQDKKQETNEENIEQQDENNEENAENANEKGDPDKEEGDFVGE
ncbi:MAG: hypothetical protein ACK5RA_10645, partial [Cyanobacteriota bacterium]